MILFVFYFLTVNPNGVGEQQVLNSRPIGHRAIYVDRLFLWGVIWFSVSCMHTEFLFLVMVSCSCSYGFWPSLK